MSIHTRKENGFMLTEEKSRRYPTQTIMNADYANDIALLERAVADIGLYVNTHRTEYICFDQRGENSTLNSISLKLVDKFT